MEPRKLTPAPWNVTCGSWGNGGVYPYVSNIVHGTTKDAETDCEFIALARNAFDVMMRRGWTPSPIQRPGQTRWQVRMRNGADMPLAFICDVLDHRGEFADPFTALVAADKWMRENAENRAYAN